MPSVLLRLLGVAVATVLVFLLGLLLKMDPENIRLRSATILGFLGSLSLFLAPYLELVIWRSHGLTSRPSPAAAFRILGVLLLLTALGCLFL